MKKPQPSPPSKPMRSISSPAAWADWPDARVHCRDCRNKSGYMCTATKTSCNASEMPFYCDLYSARGR